jgi:hypothetical protein
MAPHPCDSKIRSLIQKLELGQEGYFLVEQKSGYIVGMTIIRNENNMWNANGRKLSENETVIDVLDEPYQIVDFRVDTEHDEDDDILPDLRDVN